MEYEPHRHVELGWPIVPLLRGDWHETYIFHDADTVEYVTKGGCFTIIAISSNVAPVGNWLNSPTTGFSPIREVQICGRALSHLERVGCGLKETAITPKSRNDWTGVTETSPEWLI